jgi:hypothetical protein
MKALNKLAKDYQKKYGYMPTDYELLSLYQQGYLTLTDKQENEVIQYFESLNLI